MEVNIGQNYIRVEFSHANNKVPVFKWLKGKEILLLTVSEKFSHD